MVLSFEPKNNPFEFHEIQFILIVRLALCYRDYTTFSSIIFFLEIGGEYIWWISSYD
jgi:hypothetical protein